MKLHIVVVLVLISTALAACADEQKIAEWRAARAAIEPSRERFAKVLAALPPPGSESEKRCEGAIPAEGLETIEAGLLAWALGEGAADESQPRVRGTLSSDMFIGLRQDFEPMTADDEEPSTGGLINLKRSAEELASVRHLVVLRATEVDEGQIGPKKAGSYTLERPARWRGWAFVYAFDGAELRAALPLDATSRDSMTVMVRPGYAPARDELLYDLAIMLRRELLERLARPGCSA
jgi:hypothetical protein